FGIFLAVHRKHVVNQARGRRAYEGHALQALLQMVEERYRNFQNAVQGRGLHLVGIASPKIAEAVPLVVSAVKPDDEQTAGLQVFIQRFDGGFAIRGVMEHTDAIDDVEAFGSEWKGEDIGLKSDEVAAGKISGGNFGGGAQVNAHHARAPAGSDFGEASHAATDVKDQFAIEILGAKSGLHEEMTLGFAKLVVIELRLLITVPLETEAGGIVLGVNEARDALHVRIDALAERAEEARGRVAFKSRATTEAAQNCLQVSGQGRLHRWFRDRHRPPGSAAAFSAPEAPSRVLFVAP